MEKKFRQILIWFSCSVGHPIALVFLTIYSCLWFVLEKYNIGWDGWGQIVALIIVIAIQASQNRDTAALHAKLDELIISIEQADSRFAGIEKKDEDEITKEPHTPKDC